MANASQIQKVCEIISNDPGRRVIVVSAPGRSKASELKITDLLIAYAKAKMDGFDGRREEEIILRRFADICKNLNLKQDVFEIIKADLLLRSSEDVSNRERYMAAVKSVGERAAAQVVSAYLQLLGYDAEFMEPYDAGFVLDGPYEDAVVLPETYEKLLHLGRSSKIVVIPGFYAKNDQGEILTFSRGGSDITGAVLAAALKAAVYENWTDVSAIYTVNPMLVNDPVPIRELSYREMRELAYLGTGVLHPEALAPTYAEAIPIHILNTNMPDMPGTLIVKERTNYGSVVTGIAGSGGFVSLNISEYLLNRRTGILTAIFSLLTEEGINFDHMPSSIDSVSIIMRDEIFTPEKEKICVRRLKDELGLETVDVCRGLAVVMIVGEAMKDTVGVAARAVKALSAASVSIDMIIQDHSEMSVIFVVDGRFCNYAVEILYNEYFIR